MKKRTMKGMAGLCMAAVMAALPVLSVQASDKSLSDATPGGQTDVTVEVTAPGMVSYIIAVPDKVDFGSIQQPNSSEVAPVMQTFEVSCDAADGLASGQAIAVMVKDYTATGQTDPFVLVNENTPANKLTYTMTNSRGNDITTANWYDKGYLFNTFTAADQKAEGTLTLDRSQLYNKDASWRGAYSGQLEFYTKIANVHAS